MWYNTHVKQFMYKNGEHYLENPLLSRIAKSPTSCGISCTSMATAVITPSLKLVRNEAATANPCTKLSIQFAKRFRYPTIGFAVFCRLVALLLLLLLASSEGSCEWRLSIIFISLYGKKSNCQKFNYTNFIYLSLNKHK